MTVTTGNFVGSEYTFLAEFSDLSSKQSHALLSSSGTSFNDLFTTVHFMNFSGATAEFTSKWDFSAFFGCRDTQCGKHEIAFQDVRIFLTSDKHH